MKKLFTLFLALVASVGIASAQSGTCGDNLTWVLQDSVLTISGTGDMWNWSGPDPYSVIDGAAPPWVKVNNGVVIIKAYKEVVIQEGVTSIGDYAFSDSGLKSVTIPNSVTSIGSSAFEGCTGLTSITIPNSVTSIGRYAFEGCTGLTSITIPNSVTSIGGYAFKGCTGLTSPVYNANVFAYMPTSYSGAYTIPEDIESIASAAFYGCASLTSVTIPNSVTSIGDFAFNGCISLPAYDNIRYADTYLIEAVDRTLSTYSIKEETKWIGSYAFTGCSSLTSITIPNSVTSIEVGAFWYCPNLTSVTIGNSVTSIGGCAFEDCSSLTSVTIPNSVTSIGSSAFSGCASLTSVTIPNSVTSIGYFAFSGCTGLASIVWNAKNCLDFTSDNTPFHGLRYVNGGHELIQFDIRANISFFVFGEEVEHIPANLCYGMTNLTSLMIDADTPPTLGIDALSNTNDCLIYVPCGTLDIYKTAWSEHASRIAYSPININIETKVNNEVAGEVVTPENMCDEMIVTAIPNRGYKFTKWSEGNTDNPRSFVLQEGLSFTAIFDYALSGKCGKDSALTWTFEPASMALNITGKGTLSENYTYGTFIESLTIGNEVTTIGEDAFCKCTNLKNVIIGSSVKVLETAAFAYCSSIETITCYSQRPPTVNQNALYGLDYSTIVYVPADYLNTYKMHDAWGLYDVRPLGATSAETEDVKITPSENEANVTWPAVSGAASYELVIKDKDGNIVCTLIFNANGQLTSIAFNAPSRNGAPAQTQSAGFSFTITGLDSGTGYDLTLTAKDNSGNTIDETTIPFHTDYPEGIENVQGDKVQSTKVVKDGQVLILRNGKTYTMQGQEVK